MPRSNMPLKPTNAVDIATSTNAPIASDSGTPALLAISIAAPGVDHAVTIGIRQRSDRPMQVTPMPMPNAHSQDAVSASDAPSVCAAWNTITAELVNPTSTVTKPAATDDGAMSRSHEPWGAGVVALIPRPAPTAAVRRPARNGSRRTR